MSSGAPGRRPPAHSQEFWLHHLKRAPKGPPRRPGPPSAATQPVRTGRLGKLIRMRPPPVHVGGDPGASPRGHRGRISSGGGVWDRTSAWRVLAVPGVWLLGGMGGGDRSLRGRGRQRETVTCRSFPNSPALADNATLGAVLVLVTLDGAGGEEKRVAAVPQAAVLAAPPPAPSPRGPRSALRTPRI
ncbi:uncharacterized protein LOC128932569 [Callithrix jacchus]